jgi:hypothetical protein
MQYNFYLYWQQTKANEIWKIFLLLCRIAQEEWQIVVQVAEYSVSAIH